MASQRFRRDNRTVRAEQPLSRQDGLSSATRIGGKYFGDKQEMAKRMLFRILLCGSRTASAYSLL